MTKFTAHIATAAAIVGFAIAGAASAKTAAPLALSDINLAQPQGRAAFEARVESVQRHFCSDSTSRRLQARAACRRAVMAEIVEKLGPQQRLALSGQTYSVATR